MAWAWIDGNEAAARIAHRLSEVVAIYPTPGRPTLRGSAQNPGVSSGPDPAAFERGNYVRALRSWSSGFRS